MDQFWLLNHKHDSNKPDSYFTDEGYRIINGFEGLHALKEKKNIIAASEHLGIVLVPLVKDCTPYFLGNTQG